MNPMGRILLVSFAIVLIEGCGGGSRPPAMLSLSQSDVMFSAPFGGANPAGTTVNVSVSGTAMASFAAASDSPWLSVTPGNGTAPNAIQISAALGALTTASYTGHITVTAPGALGSPATVAVTFAVGGPPPSNAPTWAQWGAIPQHTGMVNVAGQNLANKLADIVYDPFVEQEKAEQAPSFGEPALTVHYQAPLTDGNDVYMVMKTGTFTPCNPPGAWTPPTRAACGPNTWSTMIWNEARFTWENGKLVQIWSFMSDWKPEPNLGGLGGWEPVFHPVDANSFIYVPGAGGTVWKIDKTNGTSVSHINAFSGIAGFDAADTYVSGPLTADSQDNIYYNVIQLNPIGGDPWFTNDVAGAWLVKVAPNDAASSVTFAALVPNALVGSSNNCLGTFFNLNDNGASLPWPPSANAVPPPQACGSQRPGINIAPVVAQDGTIYTASMAHFDGLVSYLVAVNPDLTPKWAASLQNRLADGCGVLLPIAPQNVTNLANSCRFGTQLGVDPTTNANGSGIIADQSSASPTILPDGSVLFGAVDNYNFSRGHLFHFDAQGNYLNAFPFGWDSTPGVYPHTGTYSIIIKDNHYQSKAYCYMKNNPVCKAVPPGPYFISQLDANLNIEWSFQSTTIDNNHPNGYEWCINMPTIDMNGNVYVNSEDGSIYALAQGHSGVFTIPQSKAFLNLAVGAAYTPLSIGPDGKLYTQNNGHLFVVGN